MKAYWVPCGDFFAQRFAGICGTVVRRDLGPLKHQCAECKVLVLKDGTGRSTTENSCGTPQCTGAILDLTEHEHLLYIDKQEDDPLPMRLVPRQHVAYKCGPDCEKHACMFCQGGLFACAVCNSLEGATTTECPGKRMTADQSEKVYTGKLDFVGGKWVYGACSRISPAWWSTPQGKKEMEQYRNAAASKK